MATGGEYLPLGCYGKAPAEYDFVERGASFPTSRAFKEWVAEGRSLIAGAAEGREKVAVQEKMAHRFLFGLPGSTELLAGVIRPSADRDHKRSFPLAVFVHFPRRSYGGHFALLPLALSSVWEALDDAWAALTSALTGEGFRECLDSFQIPAPPRVPEARAKYDAALREQAAPALGGTDAALVAWLEEQIPLLVARARRGDGDEQPVPLPVSVDLGGACRDAAFWIDILGRQFFLRRVEPTVFIQEGHHLRTRSAFLFFGPPRPATYKLLMFEEGAGRAPLLQPAVAGGAESATPAPPAVTFADLLARRFRS